MHWKPTTCGEDLFLRLHRGLGQSIDVRGLEPCGLDFLVSKDDYLTFVRLVASMEVFMRCVRTARDFHVRQRHSDPAVLGRELRNDMELPKFLWGDRVFCELAKRVGHVAHEKPRNKTIERNATSREAPHCYLCGVLLVVTAKNSRTQFTIEHLWPQSFGGETVEENLLPACKDCNQKRMHMLTWASGPVQSTYYYFDSNEPSSDVRLSLALARLVRVASQNHRNPITLKQAAKASFPLHESLQLDAGKHYLYLELLGKARGAA